LSHRDASVPVIGVERVSKRYGDYVAVHEASFEVGRGEFFSMLGPSGCGKTTMLRMIAGFESVSSGVLRLDGTDVSGVPPYRRAVNTVFQNYALFPHLSVFDNIAFGPRLRGLDRDSLKQRVHQMLDVVRLGDFAGRKPGQLSGGQRQRVALARALVNNPVALLLDEPLSALDLELRRQMQIELKRIQREVGITFVFVTHDQEEALTMSDRIAVMRGGRLEQVGTPEEIYDAPASAFVARFIGVANLVPVTIVRADGARATVTLPGGGSGEAMTTGLRFAAGESAVLMVRPERLELVVGQPSTNLVVLPVTCADLVFQGAVLRCALRDPAGNDLVAHVEAARRDPGLRSGASLWLAWPPAAGRLLRPDVAPGAGSASNGTGTGTGAAG
jgi:spermidine/putrescine transport system ATP-binding protein